MSVPTHPIQLAADYPSWASWTDHGDGRYGPTLQGRGLGTDPAIVAPRFASNHGNSNLIIGRCEYNCTASSSANGYEGIGLSVHALKRNGSAIETLWWNDPMASGNTDYYINDNTGQWKEGQIVVTIPSIYQPDWIATSWFLHGAADGVVHFNALEFQDFRNSVFSTYIAGTLWTDFAYQTLNNFNGVVGLASSAQTGAYTKYLDTHVTAISSGTNVTVNFSSFIDELFCYDTDTSAQVLASMGVALKLNKADGTNDWWSHQIVDDTGSTDIDDYQADITESFIAPNAYESIEKVLWIRPLNQTSLPVNVTRGIDHDGMRFDAIVGESYLTGTT